MDSALPAPNLVQFATEEGPQGRFLVCRIPLPSRDRLPHAMDLENTFIAQCQQIGLRCMDESLPLYDTDGEPFVLGGHRYTSKGLQSETYQTYFGPLTRPRQVYQTSDGGRTHVPLEHNARIIGNATPQFARMIAAKYAEAEASFVQRDLAEHHQRFVSDTLIRDLAGRVGSLTLSKEEHWSYRPAAPVRQVATIALGYDGTCANLCYEGWKTLMVASFTLYDAQGQRLESFYLANAPEEGKETFFARAEREMAGHKKLYPEALWVGLSDGAHDLREQLEKHCQQLLLDFYHLSEYLAKVAASMARRGQTEAQWLQDACQRLKTQSGAAEQILTELKERQQRGKLGAEAAEQLRKTIGYLENNLDRTDYAEALAEHLPIGSGVTEAACKSIVKERFCGSGMRWVRHSLQQLLSIRCLFKSDGRWNQFWGRFMGVGL